MQRNIIKVSSILILFIVVLTIIYRCTQPNQVLNNIYYGYYDNRNTEQFVIFVFDKQDADKVAVRVNLDDLKFNSIFPIKYNQDTVTIHGTKGVVELHISKNLMTLTCAHCNGRSLPRLYSMGVDHHAFPDKTVNQAFGEISEDAKAQDGYDISRHE